MTAISIAELQRAGITITAHEAVAIAQHLIHDRRTRAEPPFGSPSPDNVSIGVDGSVTCRGCAVTPTASEIAIFLQAVLVNTPSVPGGLRYAIARAMHEVDAPPFDSVEDFSVVLAHYEHGVRLDVVRALAARMEPHRRVASVSRMTIDRRRAGPSSSELRRLLREADRELFEQRLVTPVPPAPRPIGSQLRIVGAAVLCVLTAGGVSVSGPRADDGPRTPAPRESAAPREPAVQPESAEPQETALPGEAPVPQERAALPQAPEAAPARRSAEGAEADGTPQKRSAPQPRAAPRVRHSSVRALTDSRTRSQKGPSRGVLAKLRLRWLRHAIVIRDDL